MHKHYIKVDNGNVIDTFSSGFGEAPQDFIFYQNSHKRHFHLDLVSNVNGFVLYNFKYENNEVIEKTSQEKQQEIDVYKNDNTNKLNKFKQLRLARLQQTQWVFIMISGEKVAGDVGDINQSDKIITPQLRKEWHDWQKDLLKKHTSIDWNSINYDDIHFGNTSLFMEFPEFPDDII